MAESSVLFEIGLEEIPARFLDDSLEQLERDTAEWLAALNLPYGKLKTYGTPRRLAVLIEGVSAKQPDKEEEVRGPAEHIAVDSAGEWTKAAIGFSKGQGKAVEDIYVKEVKGTRYIFISKFTEGRQTTELLPGFKEVVLGLNFPKNMRWGEHNLRFVRPIRWLTALYGQEIIPVEITGVTAGDQTQGHRFLGSEATLTTASDYQKVLEHEYVIADRAEREQLIRQGIEELEEKEGWQVKIDSDLLREVRNLVEFPTVFSGSFSEEFLDIPEEVLITSMKEHQRYFPVYAETGELMPVFVGVRNGNGQYLENVAKGNEKVLKARLSDARFFYEEDQKHSIEENLAKLERMVYQEKLGTIADKVNRVAAITRIILEELGLPEEVRQRALRAAAISKFDLVTNMVNEFTELQGIMGEKYARTFGENETTAKAINEHYMPRHANDQLPATLEGSVVSVADKLDTIVGCLSVGIVPSGSQDPYGLRRQGIGILQIIKKQGWDLQLEELLHKTFQIFQELNIPLKEESEVREELESFFRQRASFILKEKGLEQDVVDAVLYQGIGNFSFAFAKAEVLSEKRASSSFKKVQEALVRVLNIANKGKDRGVDETLFENEFEAALYEQYQQVKTPYLRAIQEKKAVEAVQVIGRLADPIHQYFDHTMVMAEEEAKKENRLSLLNKIAFLVYQYADLTAVQWKQHY